MAQELVVSVTGGYNGGAVINMTLDNVQVFTSTASDTYNQNYDNLSGSFMTEAGSIDVTVTPPPTSSSVLTITLEGALSEVLQISPAGQNTSYGYNYSEQFEIIYVPPVPPEWYDTGLGWGANDNYLIYTAGASIATVSPLQHWTIPGFETQEIPVTAQTSADIIGSGLLVMEFVSNNAPYKIYVGAAVPGCLYALFHTGGTIRHIIFLPSPNAIAYVQQTENNQPQGGPSTLTYDTVYVGSDAVHVRYQTVTGYNPTSGTDFYYVPKYQYYPSLDACVAAAWADIAQSGADIPITKSNTGWATAALVKWRSATGEKVSPILISSDPALVQMDYTASLPEQLSSHLKGGRRFVMRMFTDLSSYTVRSRLPVLDFSQLPYTMNTDRLFIEIASVSWENIQTTDAPDPYEDETGSSGEEGGGGTDPDDDPVEEELLPIPSVAGHGFCTIYIPTSAELKTMANYLWSGNFDVSQVLKLFSNPMDSILGLSAVPLSLSGIDPPDQIYLGGVPVGNVTMHRYGGRTAVKVDMGTVSIEERWGAYLDYDPYTEFSIYLPFIGIKPIKADDIMGKTLSLMYHIDILSGGCIAYLRPVGGSVLYEWSGQCAVQIPVTGRNFDNVFQSAMSLLTAAGAAITAPAAAPVLTGAVASAAVQAVTSKPRVERSGTMNGITGFLGQQRPYIIRTIPEAFIPANQNKFIGYPAYITLNLGSLTGYNEVASIHLEGIPATADELSEIETILKEGVIF